MIVLNISLSSFYIGYVLCYFNTMKLLDIMNIFHITLDPAFAQGFISFSIPIGAAIGSYLSKYLLMSSSRCGYFLKVNYIVIVSTIFLQIPNFFVLFTARLLQGFCLGLYCCICNLYIKEFVPI
jgi:predicted MFS family arabinose efflux permease